METVTNTQQQQPRHPACYAFSLSDQSLFSSSVAQCKVCKGLLSQLVGCQDLSMLRRWPHDSDAYALPPNL